MDASALKGKKFLFIGGGSIAALLILEMRKKKSAATAASTATSADTTAADTATPTDNSGDSAYGDYSSDSGFSGTSSDGSAVGSPYGSLSNLTYNPSTGQYTTSGTTVAPSTNGAWTQQATGYLVGVGDDSSSVAAALGAYINGSALTDDQYSIVQAAIAAQGYPPIGVPSPSHIATPPGQVTGSGSVTNPAPTPAPAPAPAPVAQPVAQPVAAPAPAPASLSETQVRAASPRVAALYAYYIAHPGKPTMTAYQDAVNDYRTGGEAHVATVAAVQANDRAHGFTW